MGGFGSYLSGWVWVDFATPRYFDHLLGLWDIFGHFIGLGDILVNFRFRGYLCHFLNLGVFGHFLGLMGILVFLVVLDILEFRDL